MFLAKVSLLFCLILWITSSQDQVAALRARPSSSKGGCLVSRAHADSCARTIYSIGDRNQRVTPQNSAQVGAYCKKIDNAIRCLDDYRPCLRGFSRRFLKSVVSFARNDAESYCDPAERKQLLQHFACLGKDKSIREMENSCMDTYILQMKYIRDSVPRDVQFQAYCCAFSTFRSCVLDVVNYGCDKRLGLMTADYINHKLISTQKSFADIQGCSGLCEQTPINVTAALERISADDENSRPQFESPVLIFMDIAARHARKKS